MPKTDFHNVGSTAKVTTDQGEDHHHHHASQRGGGGGDGSVSLGIAETLYAREIFVYFLRMRKEYQAMILFLATLGMLVRVGYESEIDQLDHSGM